MPWGRVGSNLINTTFAGIEGVQVHNEPLTGIETKTRLSSGVDAKKLIANEQMQWLNRNLNSENMTVPTIVNHSAISTADPASLKSWIIKNRPNIICLDRNDDAEVALSIARAEAWILDGHEKGEARNWSISKNVLFRPNIPADTLISKLTIIKSGRKIMDSLVADLDYLSLYYEDILSDLDGVMVAIFKESGVNWREYQIRTARFGGGQLADLVSNPEEVAATISQYFPDSRLAHAP